MYTTAVGCAILPQHSCSVRSCLAVVWFAIVQESGIDDCMAHSPFQILPDDYIRFLPSFDVSKRNGSASFRYRVWDGTADPCQVLTTGECVTSDNGFCTSSHTYCASWVHCLWLYLSSLVSTGTTLSFEYSVIYENRAPVVKEDQFILPNITEDATKWVRM